MNAMIGSDFDKGLAALKTVAEADFKRKTEEAAKRAADEAAAKAAAAGTEKITQSRGGPGARRFPPAASCFSSKSGGGQARILS